MTRDSVLGNGINTALHMQPGILISGVRDVVDDDAGREWSTEPWTADSYRSLIFEHGPALTPSLAI